MRAIDPIDRIALMEKLGIGKECTVCEQNSEPYCKWKPDIVDVCEAICTAPTIEPERKKGKWITDKYGNVLCSECNWCAPQTMTGCLANRHLDYEKSAFCWHCGADMREPEDIPMEYFESGGR